MNDAVRQGEFGCGLVGFEVYSTQSLPTAVARSKGRYEARAATDEWPQPIRSFAEPNSAWAEEEFNR